MLILWQLLDYSLTQSLRSLNVWVVWYALLVVLEILERWRGWSMVSSGFAERKPEKRKA